jgi:hypothetical protein
MADAAIEERRQREAAEAGRRQREHFAYPAQPIDRDIASDEAIAGTSETNIGSDDS